MRQLAILIVICFFSLSALADEATDDLPFVYMTFAEANETTWTNYDLHIMDAATGEIMREITTDFHDCGMILSQTPFAVIVQQSENQSNIGGSYQVLIEDEAPTPLLGGRLRHFAANLDLSRIAFYDVEYQMFTMYLPQSNEDYWESQGERILDTAFVGEQLVYVQTSIGNVVLGLWDGVDEEQIIFAGLGADNIIAELAPNGEFILLLSDSLYKIDVNAHQTEKLDGVRISSAWKPHTEATFAYINENGGVSIFDLVSNSNEEILAADGNAPYSDLYWSLDGSYLAIIQSYSSMLTASLSAYDILLLDMATGETSRPVQLSYPFNWKMTWLSDSQFVYTYQSPDDTAGYFDIHFYDAGTREERQLTNTPSLNEYLICSQG